MIRWILTISFTLVSWIVFGQFEHKLAVAAFTSIPIYEAQVGEDPAKNIFNAYPPIPYIGGGVSYGFNTKLSAGANLKYMYGKKENYTISNVNLGIGIKYNLLPNDKPVSPFLYGEINVNYVYLSQQEDSISVNTQGDYPIEEVNHQYVYKTYPVVNLGLFPVLGYMIGAGVDFNVKQKYGVFVSVNYLATNAHEHNSVKEFFPKNESKLSFVVFMAGVKFAFLKSKSI